ncbi:MAG TPA: hypothetical protein V6C99_08935 [Oculatellaceae cyanobacterium]|jgi:NADH:ubiquinone oxidoreductase subunit C
MSKESLKERLSGIRGMRRGPALRLAIYHHAQKINSDVLAELQFLDQQLMEARQAARASADFSVEEERCIARVRALEDKRFKLLSELSGKDLLGYTL